MSSSRSNAGTRSIVLPPILTDGQVFAWHHTGPDTSSTELRTDPSVDNHDPVRKVLSPPFLVVGTSLVLVTGLTLAALRYQYQKSTQDENSDAIQQLFLPPITATHQPTIPINSQGTDLTTTQQT